MAIAGRFLRRLRWTGLYLLLLSPACAIAADARYQIAQGPLEQALRQWSQQSGSPLLFGSNMALRATAWRQIADEVCRWL